MSSGLLRRPRLAAVPAVAASMCPVAAAGEPIAGTVAGVVRPGSASRRASTSAGRPVPAEGVPRSA